MSNKRLEYTIIMLLGGIILCGFCAFFNIPPKVAMFGNSLGLALIVSGLVLLYEEIMDIKVGPRYKEYFDEILSRLPPGLRKIVDERRDYTKYQEWVGIKEKCDLFFAGHSVLNRIQADFAALPIKTVESAVIRKLKNGSVIKILFLDPSWEYVEEIVASQNQHPNEFYHHLRETLNVVKAIAKTLENKPSLPGELEIKMCRSDLRYSYHRIKCVESGEVDMLVGFYFASMVGIRSPLFRVETKDIQAYFNNHFKEIFEARQTKSLFVYNGHEKRFYTEHHSACLSFLEQKINQLKTMSGGTPADANRASTE